MIERPRTPKSKVVIVPAHRDVLPAELGIAAFYNPDNVSRKSRRHREVNGPVNRSTCSSGSRILQRNAKEFLRRADRNHECQSRANSIGVSLHSCRASGAELTQAGELIVLNYPDHSGSRSP